MELRIAIADIIYQCERENGNNLDTNLINIVYSKKEISQILENNQISKIFFTSRYVETMFRRNLKDILNQHSSIELETLPSPSPRYARMTMEQKIKRYKELLPQISSSDNISGRCKRSE